MPDEQVKGKNFIVNDAVYMGEILEEVCEDYGVTSKNKLG